MNGFICIGTLWWIILSKIKFWRETFYGIDCRLGPKFVKFNNKASYFAEKPAETRDLVNDNSRWHRVFQYSLNIFLVWLGNLETKLICFALGARL